MGKRPNRRDLTEAAAAMRDLFDVFPAEEDSPKDAALRRRVEGAVMATELAAGDIEALAKKTGRPPHLPSVASTFQPGAARSAFE